MKRKQERTILTLALWQAACAEIQKNASDYYKTLLTLKPITLKQGNSATDTFIQFDKEQEIKLKNIAKQLNPNTCFTFIQLCYELLPSPTVNHLKLPLLLLKTKNPLILPPEVVITHVGRYLNRHTVSSLISTCSFFYNNKLLSDLKDSKSRIEKIITNKSYTLMLTSKKKLFVAGSNNYGQLGIGDIIVPDNFTETYTGIFLKGETIQGIYAGNHHTLVLTNQARLFACGQNRFGQLGIGNTINQFILTEACKAILFDKETIEKVYAGDVSNLILTSQGRLFACGYNEFGQLGIGNTTNQSTFVETFTGILLKGETIQKVYYAGGKHTLVFTSQDRFFACGYNEFGQLGIGNTADQKTFTETCRGILLKGETIQEVYAGDHHTLILTSQNRLFACGCNGFGQIGIGNITDQSIFTETFRGVLLKKETIQEVYVGGNRTLVLTSQSRLFACGCNDRGQIGIGNTTDQRTFIETFTGVLLKGETIQGVYTGNYHSLVLTSQGRLFACGYNEFGQLGIGNTTNQNTFTETCRGILLKGETIQEVYAEDHHTFILTSIDRLFVCGSNEFGRLGLKDRENLLHFTLYPLPNLYHSLSTEKNQANEDQEPIYNSLSGGL